MAEILWLSNETPDQHGQGGQRRQFFQVRELARAGHSVTVCTLGGPQDDAAIRQHATVVRTRTHWKGRVPLPSHRRLLTTLASRGWRGVVVAHTESWPTFSSVVRRVAAPTWVDLHNVLGLDISGRVTSWAPIEREISAGASVVSVCSEQESARLRRQQPEIGDPVVLPHGIDPAEWRATRAPASRPVVKLFGNWAWDPNRRGLDWFLTEVWPRLEETGALCEIAGSGAEIPEERKDTATFVGRVEALDTWTADAWAVAVPVIGGVGAPVKYLEALATRAPVLSTPDGAPTAQQSAALVSGDPQAWVMTLKTLLGTETPPSDTCLRLEDLSWERATYPLLAWVEGG